MNLGELEDGALTAEQLWEVLGNNNNEEEEVERRWRLHLVGRVTLDKTDNNNNADNARINITFSCDVCNDECQTVEEPELHKNSHLVKGDNVMVPVPDLDRTKIDAHILPVLIVEEYSNGQFKLGTKYVHSNSCFELNTLSNNLDIKRN